MESDTNKKGGIVFFRTNHLADMEDFYLQKIECELWLDQGACKIFQHGNMLFGFCKSEAVDQEGTITFFYPNREQVDRMYKKLEDVALNPPKMNEQFNIYNFYARDIEGHLIEFQSFNHELKPY
ncbi:MAG: VOC family protein [Bacteroidota bacterium]